MEKLEKALNDLGRIADAMEKRNELLERLVPKVQETADADMKVVQDTSTLVQAVQNVQATVAPAPVQTPAPAAIPVSDTVQTYTQEQLALAMARGLDMGLMDAIQNIIHGFGVDCLMQITPDNYGALALKLKAIGVEV